MRPQRNSVKNVALEMLSLMSRGGANIPIKIRLIFLEVKNLIDHTPSYS